MKIGYSISTLSNCGPVNILFNLVKNIDFKDNKVFIYTLKEEKDNSRISEFKELGCIIKNLEIDKKKIFLKKYLIKKQKIVLNNNLDILHTQCFVSTILFQNISGVKKVTTVHNYPLFDFIFLFGEIKGRIMAYLYQKALKNYDKVIGCGQNIKDLFLEKNNFKIDYVENGVDESNFPYDETVSKFKMREKLKIDSDKIIFISVGSLSERKNVIYLVNEFKKLSNKNYELILLGDGPLKSNILKMNLKNVSVLGNKNNVREYLFSSDYYISSSKAEGLPTSVIEAMSQKLPLILSDISPHKEIFNIVPKSGILFENNKEGKLIEVLENLKEKNYRCMSVNSYYGFKLELNAKKMCKKYFDLYKN